MNVLFQTFGGVGLLFVMAAIGFVLARRGMLGEPQRVTLSFLSLDVALPCLVFANILTHFDPLRNPDWWHLPFWWVGTTVLFGLLAFGFSWVSAGPTRREFVLCLLMQNAIFFPVALITEMFGAQSPVLVDLFLFTLFFPAFLFHVAPRFFPASGTVPVRWQKAFHPVLIATVAAVGLRLAGWQNAVPEFLVAGVRQVGAISVPLLMILVGETASTDFKTFRDIAVGEVTKFLAIKNIVFPLAMLGVLLLVRPAYPVALILFLQAAVPPVTAAPVLVRRAGGDGVLANQFLVFSMLAALIELPLMFWLFSQFFPAP